MRRPPAGATATVTVAIKDFKFSPQPVQAKVGDVVGWTNGDSAPHTRDDGRRIVRHRHARPRAPRACSSSTTAGTYTYHCKIHPTQMKDFTVVVS